MKVKKETTLKSIAVKVLSTQAKLELFHIIKDFTFVSKNVHTCLMAFHGRTLVNKENEVVLEPDDVFAHLEKGTGVPMDDLRVHSAGFFSSISPSKSKKKKKSKEAAKEESSGKITSRAATAFITSTDTQSPGTPNTKFLRENKVFPLTYRGSKFDVLDAQGGYKYAVVGTAIRRIASWKECDTQTHNDYLKLKIEYDKLRQTLIEDYPESVLTQLDEWLDVLRENKFTFNKKPKIFEVFFKNHLLPSLKAGHPITFATWTNEQTDQEIDYSCPDEVVNSLYARFPDLWTGESPILLDEKFYAYVERYNTLKRKREFSSFTPVDFFNSPIPLLLGNNYVAIKSRDGLVVNAEEKKITITIKRPKRISGTDEDEWLTVPCTYKRRFKSTRGYLEDLKITPIKNDKTGKDGTTYTVEYSVNGKRPRKAELKEPSFRLVVRNPKLDINNPKLTDFDIYLVLSLNVFMEISHPFDVDFLWKLRAKFSTAYPTAQDFGRQKSPRDVAPTGNKKESVELTKPVLLMGVDLGVRNPFAYSIHKYYPSGKCKVIDEGVFTKRNGSEVADYSRFRSACWAVRKLISSTKYFLNGNKPKIAENWLTILNDYFKAEIVDYTPVSMEQYYEWLKTHSATPRQEFKKRHNNWIISQFAFYLRTILKGLLKERMYTTKDYSDHMDWVSTLDQFIWTMRSFQMFGVDSKKAKKGQHPYKKLKTLMTNIKMDYIKKLAFNISEVAKAAKVSLVVMEQLDGLRGSVYNDPEQNRLFNTWPVGEVKHCVQVALSTYGILLCETDEQHTSQVHNETGKWAYRDENDLNVLWWVNGDGKAYSTHADVNAAKNLVSRFLSQCTTQNSVKLVRINDSLFVPESAFKKNENTKKRECGFFSKYFQTPRPVFELTDGRLRLSKKSFKDVYVPPTKKKGKTKSKSERWYFTDQSFNELIDKDGRNSLFEDVKSRIPRPDKL